MSAPDAELLAAAGLTCGGSSGFPSAASVGLPGAAEGDDRCSCSGAVPPLPFSADVPPSEAQLCALRALSRLFRTSSNGGREDCRSSGLPGGRSSRRMARSSAVQPACSGGSSTPSVYVISSESSRVHSLIDKPATTATGVTIQNSFHYTPVAQAVRCRAAIEQYMTGDRKLRTGHVDRTLEKTLSLAPRRLAGAGREVTEASATMMAMSAARAAAWDRCTPMTSTASVAARMPAVSSRVTGSPPTVTPAPPAVART